MNSFIHSCIHFLTPAHLSMLKQHDKSQNKSLVGAVIMRKLSSQSVFLYYIMSGYRNITPTAFRGDVTILIVCVASLGADSNTY